MTKVLVIFYQPLFDNNIKNIVCYYESFIKELTNNGNQVLLLNMIAFHGYEDSIINQIKTFSPNVIITFNNQISDKIIRVTDCPILLFEADSIDYFVNFNLVQKYNDRYFMVTFVESWFDKYIDLGFRKDHIITLHHATAVKNEKLTKDKNISFIGSCFYNDNNALIKYLENDTDRNLYQFLQYTWENKDYDYHTAMKKFVPENDFNTDNLYSLVGPREYILTSILDLGLHLFGVGWERIANTNIQLVSSFIREHYYTLAHNQYIYNSSKINISISHPQARGVGLPWRIYDILASDGLLITSYSKLLSENTKGFVNIPMFHSQYDARELCIKYLKEDNLRAEIIEASNEFIKKNGQWKDNIEQLETFSKVKLISDTNDGFAEFVSYQKKNSTPKTELYVANNAIVNSVEDVQVVHLKKSFKQRVRQRIKNILFLMIILICQIPRMYLIIPKQKQFDLFDRINIKG